MSDFQLKFLIGNLFYWIFLGFSTIEAALFGDASLSASLFLPFAKFFEYVSKKIAHVAINISRTKI